MNEKLIEYSTLLDQAPCGIGLFSDTDAQQAIYLNKTYYELIGYSKEEYEQLNGSRVPLLVYEEDLPGVRRFIRHEMGSASEWEYRIVNKAGQLIWIKINVSSVELENERYSFVSFVNISKEKELSDRLALVTTNVDYSISILRLEGEQAYLEYANDAFYKLTGYSKEQYFSDTMGYARRSVDAGVFDTMRPLIKKAIETGRPQTMEYPLTRSDGSISWLRRQFSAIAIPGTDAIRLLSVTGDITERHHAEEMLKNIVSYIPAGIVVYHIVDGEVTLQEANPAVCKIMGFDREDMLGSKDISFLKYTHPDDLESIKKISAAFAAPNTALHYEYRHFNPQKEAYIWLSADGRSIAQPDGSMQVYISYVDISAQKNMESEIAFRDEALRIADKSLSAGTVINSLGLNKPLLYVSENFESFLGYTTTEFKEMYSRQYVDVIHPEDYERVLELNARYSVERPKSYEMQFRFIRKDGSVFWALEKGTFIENFRGEPAYLSVFIDISEQKKSEQTLFERNAMFDVLLENSNLSMWTYDIKTHTAVLVSSKRHQRPILPTGTPNYPESVIATGFINENSVEDIRAMLRRVDSGVQTASAEIWYTPKTEEPWCDKVSYVSIFDEEGNILRTVGIAEDITAQKLAQRKYEEELNYQKNMWKHSFL